MERVIKLYDEDGIIAGYKLGDYYLMKHYTFGNNYVWIINRTGDNFYLNCEICDLIENGKIILCENFKDGKQKLLKLNEKAGN